MKLFSFITLLFCSSLPTSAQEVLTAQFEHLSFVYPSTGVVDRATFDSIARDLSETLKRRAYPIVPEALLKKISGQEIRVEFVSLNRGGGFDVGPHGELIIQLKDTYLKHPEIKSRLIHEWFHALHYTLHPDEPVWMREGLATLFVYLAADGTIVPKYTGQSLLDAMQKSTTPLKFAFNRDKDNGEAYGHVLLYFLYLYQNCGKNDLFWKLVEGVGGEKGVDSINAALKNSDLEVCGSFANTGVQAEIARFHNRVLGEETFKSRNRYFLIPDFPIPVEVKVALVQDLKTRLDTLPAFQPLIVAKEEVKKLRALSLGADTRVFSLNQSFPYQVVSGTKAAKGNENFRTLVIKTK